MLAHSTLMNALSNLLFFIPGPIHVNLVFTRGTYDKLESLTQWLKWIWSFLKVEHATLSLVDLMQLKSHMKIGVEWEIACHSFNFFQKSFFLLLWWGPYMFSTSIKRPVWMILSVILKQWCILSKLQSSYVSEFQQLISPPEWPLADWEMALTSSWDHINSESFSCKVLNIDSCTQRICSWCFFTNSLKLLLIPIISQSSNIPAQ